jgi:DnaJ-class molecular chaperone
LQFFGKEEDKALLTLGLKQGAFPIEIKKAHQKLSSQWNPESFVSPRAKKKAEEKFKEINEAYEILTKEIEEKEAANFETITELEENLKQAEEERTLAAKAGQALLAQNEELTEEIKLLTSQLKNKDNTGKIGKLNNIILDYERKKED